MTLDEAFVKALVEDYEHAPISAQDRVMLDYVGVLAVEMFVVGGRLLMNEMAVPQRSICSALLSLVAIMASHQVAVWSELLRFKELI